MFQITLRNCRVEKLYELRRAFREEQPDHRVARSTFNELGKHRGARGDALVDVQGDVARNVPRRRCEGVCGPCGRNIAVPIAWSHTHGGFEFRNSRRDRLGAAILVVHHDSDHGGKHLRRDLLVVGERQRRRGGFENARASCGEGGAVGASRGGARGSRVAKKTRESFRGGCGDRSCCAPRGQKRGKHLQRFALRRADVVLGEGSRVGTRDGGDGAHQGVTRCGLRLT